MFISVILLLAILPRLYSTMALEGVIEHGAGDACACIKGGSWCGGSAGVINNCPNLNLYTVSLSSSTFTP
jgi:hypothetical protein